MHYYINKLTKLSLPAYKYFPSKIDIRETNWSSVKVLWINNLNRLFKHESASRHSQQVIDPSSRHPLQHSIDAKTEEV